MSSSTPPVWLRPREPEPPLILDNEALQALRRVEHPKHRRALAILEAVLGRTRGVSGPLVAPTAVRVSQADERIR